MTGNHGAVALMAGLHAVQRTGKGQWIDMSLLEAAGPFFAQPFLEYTVTGNVPTPLANRSRRYSPSGLHQCFGRDCWLAVTVTDEGEWAALCAVIGKPEWAKDSAFASAEARRQREAEIDAAIGAWAAARDHISAARELQAAGVPAGPVLQNWEIISDNHLNQRDFFLRISQRDAGTWPYPGYPWRFEKTPGQLVRAAPLFAEHNHEVFRGLLGLDEGQVKSLYAEGVTSDDPIYAGAPGL